MNPQPSEAGGIHAGQRYRGNDPVTRDELAEVIDRVLSDLHDIIIQRVGTRIDLVYDRIHEQTMSVRTDMRHLRQRVADLESIEDARVSMPFGVSNAALDRMLHEIEETGDEQLTQWAEEEGCSEQMLARALAVRSAVLTQEQHRAQRRAAFAANASQALARRARYRTAT
jgi:hypothetical protein